MTKTRLIQQEALRFSIRKLSFFLGLGLGEPMQIRTLGIPPGYCYAHGTRDCI